MITISAPLLSFGPLALTLSLAACASRADLPEHRRAPGVARAHAPAPDANTPAAEVVGRTLTVGEVDETISDALAEARATYEMAIYEARRGALDARIADEVLRAEASRRGVTVEALIAAEVNDKVTPTAEPELRAFYEQYQHQMDGAPYEMMAERIRQHLDEEKQGERQRGFLAELKKRHGARVLLEPPRVEVEAKGPSRGPKDAKVTIVIYSDFECPFCARAEPTLAKIRETFPDDVRFVFRHYPLPFHQAARPAAAAASCADEQGRFWQVHDHVFETGELGLDRIRALLETQEGFDLARYDACMDAGRGERVVEEDMASAGRVRVDGTPHFFINGVRVSGAQGFEVFEGIIRAELDR